MSYQYGRSAIKPRTEEVQAELSRLDRIKAAILTETIAKENELARIQAARKRLEPIATYAPSPEALAYREQFGHLLQRQLPPIHGGLHGLRMAADEAALYEHEKRQKDGPNARLGR